MSIFDNCLTLKSKVDGYIDVDWVSNISNKKSTSDFMFSFGSGVGSWSNYKQLIVALSSMKVE
jgi:hypothetical protein